MNLRFFHREDKEEEEGKKDKILRESLCGQPTPSVMIAKRGKSFRTHTSAL